MSYYTKSANHCLKKVLLIFGLDIKWLSIFKGPQNSIKILKMFCTNQLKRFVDWDQYFVARKGTMMTLIISTVKNSQCN